MKMDSNFREGMKSEPESAAARIINLVEETGGSVKKPSYDGLHLVDGSGKTFALLLTYKGAKGTALYLHSTTIPQVEEFAKVNGLAWAGRIHLAKKGYEPALLGGISPDEVTPDFLAAVQLAVADGAQKRSAARAASKAATVTVEE